MRKFFYAIICILLCAIIGTLVYARFIEPSILRVERVTIPVERKFAFLEKIKVVFITDIHYNGESSGDKMLSKVISTTNDLCPDIVILGGDYAYRKTESTEECSEHVAKELSRIRSRYGIFAVLGNHEYGIEKDMAVAFLENGIHILDNDNARIDMGLNKLYIAGLNCKVFNFQKAYARISKDDACITVTHIPDFLKKPYKVPTFLYLCGNTHGGQTKEWILKILAPKFDLTYNRGLYENTGKYIYVSSGVGLHKNVKFRFLCPPEIVELTFSAK